MSLPGRAAALLRDPRAEWARIAAEPDTVAGVFTRWVLPLAAITPVASFVGYSLVGSGAFGGGYRVPIGAGVASMILGFGLTLASVYLLALAIDALAPQFGGERDFTQAFKVAAYAPTAAWIAGAFSLVPALAILGLAGLYSFWLLYVGLTALMKVPEDKATACFLVVVIAALVLGAMEVLLAGLVVPAPARGY